MAAPPVKAPVKAPVAPPTVTPPTPPPATAHRVQVQAHEFYLTLSRPQVDAGDTTVEFVNRGEDPHDLRLRPADGADSLGLPETPSLGTASGVFGLAAGDWTLYCSLPGHESLGMKATLRVR